MSTQTVTPEVSPSANLVQIGSATVEETIQQRLAAERARLEREAGLVQHEHHQFKRPKERPFTKSERGHTMLLFGGLTWKHEKLVQGALEGLGYLAAPVPTPNVKAFQAGKEYGNNGQCNPTYFTVGNLVTYLQSLEEQGMSRQEIIDTHVFFTAGACGPCRFGMYEAEYRLALRNSGFDGFRVLLFQQSGGLNQTSSVPTAGISDASAVVMPKNKGCGKPVTQKPMAATTPCASPVRTVPDTVMRPTRRNSASSPRVCLESSGETTAIADTMRGQYRSTRCMVSMAKNKSSIAAKAPDASAPAIVAEPEAISPAAASRRAVTLDAEMPNRPSQPVTVSTQVLSSPPVCSCSRTVLASSTTPVTKRVTKALKAPTMITVEVTMVMSDAATGRSLRRTSCA